MRISKTYAHIIKTKAKEIFGANAQVYLFGSRVDDSKKGGDIDLLILPENEGDISLVNKYYTQLMLCMGIQKIDIIVKRQHDNRSIISTALQTGIKL